MGMTIGLTWSFGSVISWALDPNVRVRHSLEGTRHVDGIRENIDPGPDGRT